MKPELFARNIILVESLALRKRIFNNELTCNRRGQIYMSKIKFLIIGLVAAISLSAVPPVSADASSCLKANTRFASSSNALYIIGTSTTCTPADINALYPKSMLEVQNRVFLLKSNLVLQQGATLAVEGGTVAASTTDELRLMSNNNSTTNNFTTITADYGIVRINSTKVTSWDEVDQTPDYEYGSTYKRASIKVRSRYVNGVANTSRMDITNSDLGYLGYYGAESYGLTWKVMGSAFDKVDVVGDIRGSHIHNNYFGVYTFGAYGMTIDNNEFDNNVKYGLDPHDDSDSLIITNNRSHDNGDHGIICSQRCDHLLIKGNQSYNNVGHGIMLHRSGDYSTIEDNTVSYNTDSGIALFESNNDIVLNNIAIGNKNGIRLSVGSSYNTFEGNTIDGTTGNSIYTYQGSDTPTRSDGINRGNTWKSNIVKGSQSYVLKLSSTDGDRFEVNDFRSNMGAKYYLSGATNTIFVGNQTDPGVTLP